MKKKKDRYWNGPIWFNDPKIRTSISSLRETDLNEVSEEQKDFEEILENLAPEEREQEEEEE